MIFFVIIFSNYEAKLIVYFFIKKAWRFSIEIQDSFEKIQKSIWSHERGIFKTISINIIFFFLIYFTLKIYENMPILETRKLTKMLNLDYLQTKS